MSDMLYWKQPKIDSADFGVISHHVQKSLFLCFLVLCAECVYLVQLPSSQYPPVDLWIILRGDCRAQGVGHCCFWL